MPIKPNPRFDELRADLQRHAAELLGPWAGDCWRFQAITHPSGREILNGEGALRNGGRWNAPGTFAVVYGSTIESVALEESKAVDRYYGLITRKARIFVCIGIRMSRILDLTDPLTLRRLKLVAKHLKAEDWRKINADGHESLTQCVGRAAHAAGAEGLHAPSSSIKGGINIAFFPGNKAPGSSVLLHDAAGIEAMLRGRKR